MKYQLSKGTSQVLFFHALLLATHESRCHSGKNSRYF
jgi:hypothetical protein